MVFVSLGFSPCVCLMSKCVCGVCLCPVCACIRGYILCDTRGQRWVSSSVAFHLVSWDRVSHWIKQTVWEISTCLCPLHLLWGCRHAQPHLASPVRAGNLNTVPHAGIVSTSFTESSPRSKMLISIRLCVYAYWHGVTSVLPGQCCAFSCLPPLLVVFILPSLFVKSVLYILKFQRLPLLLFAFAGLAHTGLDHIGCHRWVLFGPSWGSFVNMGLSLVQDV